MYKRQLEGLALTDKPAKLFYGKNFKPTETRPLNDLGDGGKVTIWGDVFATEVKGSRRKIYFTSITDYSGSVNLKVLGDEDADMSKWENLKPGTTLIVRGNYMYDKYEHDFVVLPYDVLQVERQQRQDTAPTLVRSCAWPTAWATAPLPSPTTASARATPKLCWRPTPSTKRTPTSS